MPEGQENHQSIARLVLAASISRSTSWIVRYSRVRSSPFLGRRGVTVRFSVVGATRRRRGLVIRNPPLACLTFNT
jgi:hypothetical protein